MFWVYFTAQIILFGACVTYELNEVTRENGQQLDLELPEEG